jgi:hypothetical protein
MAVLVTIARELATTGRRSEIIELLVAQHVLQLNQQI